MAQSIAEHPTLGPLWDAARNPEAAAAVLITSYKTAWWSCPRGHSFQRQPRLFLRDPVCPQCKVAGTAASIADKRPTLARLWHPDKNGDRTPATVDATSTAPCWWRCVVGHDFQRAPLIMLRDADCPACALVQTSLAVTHPTIAAEWNAARNGAITPHMVDADHMMTAWWTCPKGHDHQATVRSRTKGGARCPTCYAGWSVEHIRTFVKALLDNVEAFDPSEKYALAMQAGLLKDKESRPFVKALTSGRFPTAELEKFARGQPSAVDGFTASEAKATDPHKDFALTSPELPPERHRADPATDPFGLPAAPEPVDAGDIDVSREAEVQGATVDASDIDVSREIDVHGASPEESVAPLPVVTAREALSALDNALIASADAETVKFLIDSAKAKLWRHAYLTPEDARQQAAAFQGNVYSSLVRDRFLNEYEEAERLPTPPGYTFRLAADGPVVPPNLMQRRVAVCVRQARRFGNWSGMGAGKTLSAILATRTVSAGLTIICCPNAVVDGWGREIRNAFAGVEVAEKTWTPTWLDPLATAARYLVLNYEQFQQPDSEANLVAFLDKNVVDFVVIDEIHHAKQRTEGALMSKRKRLVQGLVLEGAKKNAELCVLGMSGTPVINNIQEGKSLVELITGHRHDDLETAATVQNCMRLYQRLVTLGTRWRPNYEMQLSVRREEIDCAADLDEIRRVGHGTMLELEQVLTRLRLPVILASITAGEKVIVYTHYVDGIAKPLLDALKRAGHRVGLLTGDTEDEELKEFLKPQGAVDVLIASSRIATGVDGLQKVCAKLVMNCLPWTNAEYEQLIGRLYRQGSRFAKIEVVIPVTFAVVNGERWSWCESKLNRLQYKKSIADAAVDGVVPEGNLRTPTQAQQDIMRWLQRLEDGAVETILRQKIVIPLSGEPSDVKRRLAAYGDFTRINNRWYQSSSQTTHARLEANAEEWAHYHTLYREARQSWPVVPFEEEIRWLEQRDPLVVGDFGCGEALIAARMGAKHDIRSFDHIAVNPGVVSCDLAAVPLDDGVLDVAIFCLSLMGTNFTDYIREAHRCLRLDGHLHLWEPASYFDDVDEFCRGLARLGFEVMEPRTQGAFIRIAATKATTTPAPRVVLPFRERSSSNSPG